jgi:hypothetical protein
MCSRSSSLDCCTRGLGFKASTELWLEWPHMNMNHKETITASSPISWIINKLSFHTKSCDSIWFLQRKSNLCPQLFHYMVTVWCIFISDHWQPSFLAGN